MSDIRIGIISDNLPYALKSYLSQEFAKITWEESQRKFPLYTRVHFTGTVIQMAKCIGDENKADVRRRAVEVMQSGATGEVIGSIECSDVGTVYNVQFCGGCYGIPENLLEVTLL